MLAHIVYMTACVDFGWRADHATVGFLLEHAPVVSGRNMLQNYLAILSGSRHRGCHRLREQAALHQFRKSIRVQTVIDQDMADLMW
jgi:hypothetical protein